MKSFKWHRIILLCYLVKAIEDEEYSGNFEPSFLNNSRINMGRTVRRRVLHSHARCFNKTVANAVALKDKTPDWRTGIKCKSGIFQRRFSQEFRQDIIYI